MPENNIKLEKPLTEVELQLMHIIWQFGSCTVKEVQTEISNNRDLAYTSIATIMKILETKGIVKSSKRDKAHIYYPLLTKESYESQSLEHLSDNLFNGNPSMMVMRLINDTHLSKHELEAIRKVLETRLDV